MAKKISVFNQKGGVGKTTTVINLSAGLGLKGKKVLVLDLDPQCNASSGLGINVNERDENIYDALMQDKDINSLIEETSAENVYIIPGSRDLVGIDIELSDLEGREFVLKNSLESLEDNFDFIIMDCPPSLGLLSMNSLTSADSVIIPIQCEYYALEGVSQLVNTIDIVQEHINTDLEIEGVVLSMFDGRTNLSIQIVDEVKKYFKSKVFTSLIPRNVRLAEAPSHGLSIFDYDEKSRGAEAYGDLAEELLERQEW